MAKVPNYAPPPGPQQPNKYKFVGNNYRIHGEQPGFRYDPYTDQYYADRRTDAQIEAEERAAAGPPGLFETVAPIAGLGVAYYGGKAIGEKLPGAISSMWDSGGAEAAKELGSAVTTATDATAGAAGIVPDVGAFSGTPAEALGASTGMFDLAGVGSAGNVLLPAAGAIGAYDVLANDRGPVRGGLQGAASGAAIGSYFGPAGAGIGAGIGGSIGLIKGLLGDHEATKEVQERHWGKLAKSGDAATQQYAQQYLQHVERGPSDGPKFNELKSSGQLKPEHVWGGYGMFKTFGADWLNKYSEEQRRQISQAMIDAGLIDQKKGDLVVNDATKAKEIAGRISQGLPAVAPPLVQQSQPTGAPQPTGLLDPSQPGLAGNLSQLPQNFDLSKVTPQTIDPGFNVKGSMSNALQGPMMAARKDSPGFKNGKRINYR